MVVIIFVSIVPMVVVIFVSIVHGGDHCDLYSIVSVVAAVVISIVFMVANIVVSIVTGWWSLWSPLSPW